MSDILELQLVLFGVPRYSSQRSLSAIAIFAKQDSTIRIKVIFKYLPNYHFKFAFEAMESDRKKQEIADSTSHEMLSELNLDERQNQETQNQETQNFLTRERAINSFKKIANIRPQPGQEFCVIVYFLSKEISPEGSRGMWFLIGTYPRADMAKEAATSLIKDTGIKLIYAMKTCDWQDINDKFNSDRIKLVPAGRDKRLREKHLEEYEQSVEEYKHEQEIAKEIEEEQERELKPDQIEYYTRQWYLAIKNRATIEKLRQQLREETNLMNHRIKNIREASQCHPEFEG